MSSIIFSFDAQAVGLLGALDAIQGGLESLMSTAESVAGSFAQVNASAETMSAAMTNMFANFSNITSASDSAANSFGNASSKANNLAYQLQQLAERSSDAAAAHRDAAHQIEQQEADLTQNVNEQLTQRKEAFNKTMGDLVQSHADAVDQMNEQQTSLTENYYDQMNSTLVKMNDPIAMQHKMLTSALQQQMDLLLANGNTSGVAALQQQLTAENTKYQSYLTNTIEPYYQSLDQKAYNHYHKQLDALTDRINKENAKYKEQTTYLTSKYQSDLTLLELHYHQSEARLEDHLAKENRLYAQQMQRIAEERQHILDSASGGGGGGGGGTGDTGSLSGPVGIDLLKRLGIDPMKNPRGASNAILDWILGTGKAGKMDAYNPQGVAFGTEMTIPQVEALVNQSIALGKDPTKAIYKNENYANLFGDLLAYTSATAPTRSQDDRYSSLLQIMEKVLSGNTTGLRLQLANLGISPQLLAQFGVKFGGATGKTIENPQAVFGALMQMTGSVAGGLGKQFGTETFTGVVNQFKDLWFRAAQEIGDPTNPKGLWAQFRDNLTQILLFFMSHQGDFVRFGQQIFTGINNAFHKFNEFVTGPQGVSVIRQIAHAFQEVGDALKWAGQHKGIIEMIMALLAMQAGAKMLQAGAGGIMGIAGSFASGGIMGPLGGLLKAGTGGGGGALAGLLGNIGAGAGARFGTGAAFGQDAGFIRELVAKYGGVGGAVAGVGGVGIPQLPGETLLQTLARGTGTALGATRAGAALGGDAGAVAASAGEGFGGLAMRGVMGAASFASGVGPALGGALGGIGPFLTSLPALISGAVSALGPLLVGFAAAAGPILLVAGAIAGLVAVIVMNRERIMPFVNTLVHFFSVQLKDAEKAVMGFAHQVEERLGPAFGPGSFVYKALMFFAAAWGKIWPGLKVVFEGVWNVISGLIKIAWSIISGIILIGLDILGGKWGKIWGDMGHMLGGIFDGIGTILHGALLMIGGIFMGLWALVQHVFGMVWGLIVTILGNVLRLWVNLWTKNIPDALTGAFKWIMDRLNDLMNGVKDFFTNKFGQGLAQAFSGLGTILKKAVDFLIDHVLPDPLKGPVHAALGFAAGGNYPAGSLAMVGERGPELFLSDRPGTVVSYDTIRRAILGLDLRDTMAQGNRGNTINIAQLILPNVQDPQSFYRELNRAAGTRAEFGERGSSL